MRQTSLTLLLLLGAIVLALSNQSAAAVDKAYYVSPTTSPGSDCPAEPCHTLDYYASHGFEAPPTGDVCISLLFMSGVHNLSRVMDVSGLPCFKLTLAGTNSPGSRMYEVIVRLLCEFEYCLLIQSTGLVIIELMEIHGAGKMFLAGVNEATIQQVLFEDSGLHVISDANYTQTQLINLSVHSVAFLHGETGVGQLLVCGSEISNVSIEDIKMKKLEQIQPSPHLKRSITLPSFCDEISRQSVYISIPLVRQHNVTLRLRGVAMEHMYAGGLQIYIPLEELGDGRDSYINAEIRDCSISDYGGGAIVWSSYGQASLTIDNCNITNNTHNAKVGTSHALGAAAAGLTIYSTHSPIEATISNCHFQENFDLNYVMFIYNANIYLMDSRLLSNSGTAVYAYESTVNISGTVSFINNTGQYGGALHLTRSMISLSQDATVNFIGNKAQKSGGAVYINNPLFFLTNIPNTEVSCFYNVMWNGTGYPAELNFANNTAQEGGHHIYGSSAKSYCVATAAPDKRLSVDAFDDVFTFNPPLNSSLSGVSSTATRVCLCSSNNQPQCASLSAILVADIRISPGEVFSLPAILAGANFGASFGAVFASLADAGVEFGEVDQVAQHVGSLEHCSRLYYSIKTNRSNVMMYLSTNSQEELYQVDASTLNESIRVYGSTGVAPLDLQLAQISINITLAECPFGFTLVGKPPLVTCDCYSVLSDIGVSCTIENGVGVFTHSGSVWMDRSDGDGRNGTDKIIFHPYCARDFCNVSRITFDLESSPDDQCVFNHVGRLCGGCRENYSLAIGSSRCLHCTNNNHLALLIFFVAAGLLLVFLVGALNLTVSLGMFNGFIFYSNVIWTYKAILFPLETDNSGILFLKAFIAWLNLDFGIETCFFRGLDAYVKTWLQFLFPIYIWLIAGAIVIGCRHSSRMTKIFGDRAVPVLATLICLSYVKLMRIIIDGLAFSVLRTYPNSSTIVVWSLDGNLRYGGYPHIFLLLAVIAALIFLWAPYTLALIFTQWFRKLSYLRIFRWTTVYKPFYDCQFACLKDKHHYWHGTLLLARGIQLVVFTLTATSSPNVNLLILHLSAMLFLLYEVYMQLYRSVAVHLHHASLLLNLAILGGSAVYAELIDGQKEAATVVSVSIVFIQFWALIFWNAISVLRPFLSKMWKKFHGQYSEFEGESSSNVEERNTARSSSAKDSSVFFDRFRDSIFDDMQSLETPVKL